MGCCHNRSDDYSRKIDDIDRAIAALVKSRDELVERMPKSYESCGEGEVYYSLLGLERAEDVYFTVARIG